MQLHDTFTMLLPLLIPAGLIMYACGVVLKWVTEAKVTQREQLRHQVTVKRIHGVNRAK